MNKLMIVAHPDDESLFGGAALLEGGWKVICVTNGDNPIRRAEFEKVMETTNSEFEMWDYYDRYTVPLDEAKLSQDLLQTIQKQRWEKVATHNQEGEYGHPHHIQIHSLVKSFVGNLWTFNFRGSIMLPDEIWTKKMELINIYESQKHICADHIPNVRNERLVKEITFY